MCVSPITTRDIYIDLCDPGWHAIRVTAAGWTIVQSPPVRFRRSSGMQPLPFPERGTPITALSSFLNVREDDFVLVAAFVLAALRPRGPYPILVVYGEQGSAKTGLIRRLRSLIDPSFPATSSLPPSARDAFIAAHNSHVQAFENVSRLSDAMSDVLCRLATGGGMRTRKLFTDAGEMLFRGARPIAIEGITNFVTRGDLQDRSIILPIEPMRGFRTEHDLDAAFEKQRAGIFGALLDLLAHGVKMLPETHLASPPRMADFAHWAVACGLDTFEDAYRLNRLNATAVILEHDVLARAVRAMVAQEWVGTAYELLDILGPSAKITNSKVLSDQLRRLAPLLRALDGINITHEPRTADRRLIRIRRQ